jgi:hypothetical protein
LPQYLSKILKIIGNFIKHALPNDACAEKTVRAFLAVLDLQFVSAWPANLILVTLWSVHTKNTLKMQTKFSE